MTHPGNGRIVFTPERCAALKEDWEAGVDASAIMERLNTMPCAYPVASAQAVIDKARVMGLKRPEGWMRAKKQTAKARTWTDQRKELLHNLVNLIPDDDLLERLNALPGPAVRNRRSMRDRAQELGYLAKRPRKSGPNQGTWTELRTSFLRVLCRNSHPTRHCFAPRATRTPRSQATPAHGSQHTRTRPAPPDD